MNKILTALLFAVISATGQAQTPQIDQTVPAESFLGEQFCFETNFTNSGPPGFGPYLRVVLPPQLQLDSASAFGGGTLDFVGEFPVDPDPGVTETELTDPLIDAPVLGPEGFSYHNIVLPVGSVVAGGPPLPVEICVTIDEDAEVGTPLPVDLTPVYRFGDTATGDKEPIVGDVVEQDVKPTVLLFDKSSSAPESERPPGATWPYTYNLSVDIANTATINPLTISDTLPPDFQYQTGSASVTGGNGCSIVDEPSGTSPGGTLSVECTGDTVGTAGGGDVLVSYSGYIVDILDEAICETSPVVNDASVSAAYIDQSGTSNNLPDVSNDSQVMAKHVAVQKGASPGQLGPGATIDYNYSVQITDFGDVSGLVVTDVLDDGIDFDASSVNFTVDGGSPVSVTPSVTVANDTTVVIDLLAAWQAATGNAQFDAGSEISLSYQGTVRQAYRETGLSVLASDSLSNSVTADHDLVQGAAACSEGSGASVSVQPVTIDKSVVNAQPFYEPGDNVTFRLRMDIPSGDTRDIQFIDFLPLPVLKALDVDTDFSTNPSDCPGSAGICLTANDTLSLTPAPISVDAALNAIEIDWPDVASTTSEVIEVDLYATVTEDPFADGLSLTNIFQASTANTPGETAVDTGPVQIQVGAPDLVLTKGVLATDGDATIDPAPGTVPVDGDIFDVEAGDAITFRLTVENVGGSDAFEVTLFDDAPSGLTGCGVSAVVNGDADTLASAGDLFDLADPLMLSDPLPGRTDGVGPPFGAETALIDFTCTVAGSVQPEQILTNFADGAFTSQPGGPDFPGIEDEAMLTVDTVAPVKSLAASSETHTSDMVSPPRAAIGEIVRYRLATRIPQGSLPDFRIRDLLPSGLQFLDDSTAKVAFVANDGGISSSTLSGSGLNVSGNGADVSPTFTLPGSAIAGGPFGNGIDPEFLLGDLVNADDDADDEFVVIEFNALVLNIAGNSAGTNRDNRYRVFTGGGQIGADSNEHRVRVVDPAVGIAKSASPTTGEAGTTISYVVDLSAQSGTSRSDAFDMQVTDTVPGGLALDSGSISMTFGAGCGTPTVIDNSTGNTIDLTIDRLPAGCNATLGYDATLQLGVVPGSVFQNTADLAFSSLPGTGSDSNPTGSTTPGASGDQNGERLFGLSDSASVTVDSVVNAKSLVNSSEPHTGGNDLATGEIATYRLAVELPQGTSPAFAVVDTLETGLMFLDGSARLAFVGNSGGITSGDSGIGSAPQVSGSDADVSPTFTIPSANVAVTGDPVSGDTVVTFSLGELVNSDADTDAEFVVIEFDALVLNIAGNVAGVTRDNVFDVEIDGSQNGSASNVQTVNVVEPDVVNLDKQATPDSGVAGDSIDYSLTFEVAAGSGHADAFELQLVDSLPADVEFDEATVTVGFSGCGTVDPAFTDASSAMLNEVRVTFDDPLPEGCGVTVDYTAELLVTVQLGQTVTNTAELAWTSLPGTNGTGGATPGTPGDPDGERTGDGDVNDHFDSAQEGVDIAPVTLAKSVFDTSSTFTGDNEFRTGVDDLAIGETATFRITATIPEGTTPQVVITDTLPWTNGIMEVAGQSVISIGSNLNVGKNPPMTATGDGQLGDGVVDTVKFDFGQVVNDPATATGDPNENRIVVEVVGRLVDVPENTNGDPLTNNALVQFGSGLDASASAGADVVEPLLDIVKDGSITQGDADDAVTYTVTITHSSASSTTAHDLVFLDSLPPDMSLDVGSIQVVSGPGFDANASSGNNIDLGWVSLDPGQTIVLEYQATLDVSVMPGQMLDNTGALSWTSMPGTVAEERTGNDSDGHSILVTDPGVGKSVFATSEPTTEASEFGTPEDLTIGEQVTYRFSVTFPEGMTNAAVVTDQLPTASSVLEVVSSQVVSVGGNLTLTNPVAAGDAGTVTDSDSDGVADRVRWDLGDVDNAPDNVDDAQDEIEFEVVAVVLDVPANQSGDTDQLNVAMLESASGIISGNAAVDLVAPEVQLVKSVVTPSDGFVDAGDTVTVRLDIEHTGSSTADAFNALVMDTLPVDTAWGGDVNVTTDCPGLNIDSSTNPVAFDFAQLELAAGSCFIEYQYIVGDFVKPGQTLTNSAELDYDSTPTFVAGETRRRMDSDTSEVTVLAPALVKADVGTNQPDTGMAQGDPALRDLTIGETVTYELTVVFPEGQTDNAVIVDELPADANGVIEAIGAAVKTVGGNISTSQPGDAAFADARLADGLNDTVTFDFGTVTNDPDGVDNAEDRIVIELVGRVVDVGANIDGAVLVNNAQFSFDGDGGAPLTDDATVEVVEPATDLSKTMVLRADGVVRITLDVENTGSGPVYDLEVVDVLDEADWDLTGFGEVSAGAGFMLELLPDTPSAGQQTLRFITDPAAASPDGTIPVGASVEAVFELPLAVLPPVPNPLPNQADQVTADSLPGDDGNARVLPGQNATAQIAVPDLKLSKTATLQVDADGSGTVSPGDTLRYELLLANTGAGPATDIVIDDAPDANSALVAGSVTTTAGSVNTGNTSGDTTVQVAIASLAAGASEVVAYDTIVADPLPAGVTGLVNQAVFDSFELPPGVSDDPAPPGSDDPTEVTVEAAPDLVIIKDDGGVTAQPGETVVYTLDYENTGNQDATGVVISETVPSNAIFNAGAGSPGWSCVDPGPGSACEFSIGDLDAGDNGSVVFAVDIDSPLDSGITQVFNSTDIADDGSNGPDPTPGDNNDNETTPLDAAPDLVLTKDDGGATTVPGGSVVWTLSYENVGNQQATGVTLTDTVPANSSFDAGASTAGWTCVPDNSAGSSCTFNVGTVAGNGGSGSVTFAVDVDNPLAAGVTELVNGADVADDGSNGPDPTPGNNSDVDDTPINAAIPDLALTKDDGGATATPGGTVTWTLSIQNVGNQGATGVFVTDTVPANTTFNPAASSPGWSCVPDGSAGSVCSLSIGGLAGGGGADSAAFAVTVDNPLPAGVTQLVNGASVGDDGSNGADPTPGNNSDGDNTPISGAAPDLVLSKDDGGATTTPGGTVVWTLAFENVGNRGATGVVLTDMVPANTTFAPGSSSPGWTCIPDASSGSACSLAIGALAGGATGSATFAVTVDDPIASGVTELFNGATVADDGNNGADPTPGNNSDSDTTPVDAQFDLSIVKDDGGITTAAGDTVVYTLDYQNGGNQNTTGVEITETVPANTMFDAGASTAGWNCTPDGSAGSNCVFALGTLAGGAVGSVQFALVVDDPLPAAVDEIVNTAAIGDDGSNGPDPTPGDNSDGDTTAVGATPALAIVKSDGGITAAPGDTVVFSLEYVNNGSQEATGVELTETVPPNSTFVAGASTPGWVCAPDDSAGSSCVLAIGSLAGGAAGSALFAIVLDDPLPLDYEQIPNTAGIGDDGSNGPDPTPGDNESSTLTPIVLDPALELVKVASDAPDPIALGSVLEFTITATNTGNLTLTNVVVTDSLITPTGGTTPCASVAPGDTCTLIGNYEVTQQDVDNGEVRNIAGAGSDQADPIETSLLTPVPQNPAIELIKKAVLNDINSNGLGDVGEIVDYTITATNTGDVTLSNVEIVDSLLEDLVCAPSNPMPLLAPGVSFECTGSLEIEFFHLTGGPIVNIASVLGFRPDNEPVESTDNVATPVNPPLAVPALDRWALLLMVLMILGGAGLVVRRYGAAA